MDLTGEPQISKTTLRSEWSRTTWSPDSQMLAATGTNPDRFAIFDRAGATIWAPNLNVQIESEVALFWSFDGSYLAVKAKSAKDAAAELFIVDVATGETTPISEELGSGFTITSIKWSPIENLLAYAADEDATSPGSELIVSGPDGTEKRTVSPVAQDVASFGNDRLWWSCRGTRLSYELRSDGGRGLASVGSDGSAPGTIATGTSLRMFQTDPRGDRVAYIMDDTLCISNADGSETMPLSSTVFEFKWATPLLPVMCDTAETSSAGTALVFREGPSDLRMPSSLFVYRRGDSRSTRLSADLPSASLGALAYDVAADEDVEVVAYSARPAGIRFGSQYINGIVRAGLDLSGGSDLEVAAALLPIDDIKLSVKPLASGNGDFKVTVGLYDSTANEWRICTAEVFVEVLPPQLLVFDLKLPQYVTVPGGDYKGLCIKYDEDDSSK